MVLYAGERARRDLHSFPTRRSSDLSTTSLGASEERHGRSRADNCRERCTRRYGPRHCGPPSYEPARGPGRTVSWWAAMARSEEHTSELQSQSNLVCRLLLEKKKEMD